MTEQCSKEPLMVTIRCITYNHEPYIRQCLEGFVMQKTNFRFEAIVHDDASTDGTADIIREFADKYPDIIKPIFETENQYSKHDGSIRRIMDAHTHGKYVAICEGDDYWIDPLKLQKQVDFLDTHKNYGLVFTDVNCYYQESGLIKEKCFSSGFISVSKSFIEHLYNAGFIAPCSWLYRIELLNLTESKNYVDGTFPFALDVWANTNIYYMKEVTTVYRVLPNSASHSASLRKRYNFSKGLFQIKKDYINKYKNLLSEQDEFNINKRAFVMLSKSAIALSDNKFLEEAELFFKSNCLYHYYLFLKLRFIFPLKALSIHIYKKKGFHI